MKLTYEQAHYHFAYSPLTGALVWKVPKGSRALAGAPAGALDARGYMGVTINKRPYKNHRIIWLMVTGHWPPVEIDHINGIRHDNRLVNLRAVNRTENTRNAAQRKDNSSGVTGVSWDKSRQKWFACIKVNRKTKPLGRFTDKNDAIKARQRAEKYYGFHANHGRV